MPAACGPSSAGIPAWPPRPARGRAGHRCTRPAPRGGTGSTRPGPRACWPWPGMLLDAGADPNGRTGEAGGHGGWTPLRCAVAGAANPLITRLLLERGAVPGDHDLYLAGFADDNHECLRLLLFHAADVAQLARMTLAAPISLNDAEGVHLLLEAGADPDRYADDADPLSAVILLLVRTISDRRAGSTTTLSLPITRGS